ncbi:hypothetical protein FRX31_028896 [Thalictrum thalictroides]|uniref:Uncharacterized protein n=1 Tax=Thalictrum thalictroides TaxID=46969 RepID=A0A7J6V9T2_THATH|nr:hypothetical protein FRX31_028896 [Thalictrum thalictroides]
MKVSGPKANATPMSKGNGIVSLVVKNTSVLTMTHFTKSQRRELLKADMEGNSKLKAVVFLKTKVESSKEKRKGPLMPEKSECTLSSRRKRRLLEGESASKGSESFGQRAPKASLFGSQDKSGEVKELPLNSTTEMVIDSITFIAILAILL